MLALLTLLLLSLPAHADSLNCSIARGSSSLSVSGKVHAGEGQAATSSSNELGLGLDASLSTGSFLLILQDDLRARRVAFTASPLAASPEGSALGSGDSSVACLLNRKNPDKKMPTYPVLPPFLVCVLDEAHFEKGAPIQSKRVFRTTVSTALFRFPNELISENKELAFRVRFHRANFLRGLEVQLLDKSSGADARYTGPAGAMRSSFMLGLTQGNREERAKFLRLGCVFAQTPNALD